MKKVITRTKKPVAENTVSISTSPSHSAFKLLIKNILLLAGSISLLLLMKSYNNGYKWTYEILLRDNLLFMNEAEKMTEKEKMEYKLGFSWKYMNFIKENTPENAIIRMPPDSAFFPANKKSDFNQFIRSKEWASYFIYPRRLVYEAEKDSSALYNKAGYQAIVNYWGYDKLSYEIKNKVPYTILPFHKK